MASHSTTMTPDAVGGSVILHAPMAGWVSSLDEVPDEVFAQGMMGEGIAIDPLAGELLAPCDGTIVLVAPTAHAVTLKSRNGAEILLHIGLETVGLGGRGFEASVAAGQQVRQGDVLISFDLDAVALEARSLVTPLIVTNGDRFLFSPLASGSVSAGAPIGRVSLQGHMEAAAAPEFSAGFATAEVVVRLPNGLHARPAARIATAAKRFRSEVRLRLDGREASARSPVSVMALDVRAGQRIEIVADGADAEGAVAALTRLIEVELEAAEAKAPPAPRTEAAVAAARPEAPEGTLTGVCAVPGLAVGPAFRLDAQQQEVRPEGAGPAIEAEALNGALAAVRRALAGAATGKDATASAIAAAHLELVDDEDLCAAALRRIERGESAGFAWRAASQTIADALRATGNRLLVERIDDLRDIERKVLAHLTGRGEAERVDIPLGAIVIADELLPSEVVPLAGKAAGLCTAGGGPTSHVAVIAAAAGLPTLVAAGHGLSDIEEGTILLLDAGAGRLHVDPPADVLERAQATIASADAARESDRQSALVECRTADGTRIEVFANLGAVTDAAAAVAAGAEGCGLLRSEFLFLDRDRPPSEDEQQAAYQAIADGLGERPLIVRTLDVGGDKALPYLPIPPEDNPALGLRGVRVSLWRPELLDEQLRAILRVTPPGRCKIMVPMVNDLEELRAVRVRLEAVAAEIGTTMRPPLGVMIETPAAAILADQLASEADFLSIGTNDLTQYALAMDRTNPAVAGAVDAFHPAVLRLIAAASDGARRQAKPIGACGGLASDPLGAVLLVGLGLTELSAAPAAIAGVKARLRTVTIDECRTIAQRALEQDSPAAVRRLFDDAAFSSAGTKA